MAPTRITGGGSDTGEEYSVSSEQTLWLMAGGAVLAVLLWILLVAAAISVGTSGLRRELRRLANSAEYIQERSMLTHPAMPIMRR